MPKKRAKIVSVGTAVPENVVTNFDLEKFLDTSNGWIETRTGISQRHLFPRQAPGKASDLGIEAARKALQRAGLEACDIDGIICATFTPDNFFPSTACVMAGALGCKSAFAFDISAACAGFVYGLTVANSMIVSGQCKNVLLIGAEVISRTLDWTDRSTCILFGDGAGAVVMSGVESERCGILGACIASDGTLGDILRLPSWGENRYMSMKGSEVFKYAVRMMSESTKECLQKSGITKEQIDLLIPHQANMRIISSLAQHLEMPKEKVITNVQKYGNTSSASIPLALEQAWEENRIKEDTVVAFSSLGGGVTVGSAIVRF
ncbi:MAG: beta-ketoacyl-ACP synthase III [Chitinivibrionales bacterium]